MSSFFLSIFFSVNKTLIAEIKHPAMGATAFLADEQVVPDTSGAAQAVLNISHAYLTHSFNGLEVSIDYGDGSAESKVPFSLPYPVREHVYYGRGEYVITVSFTYHGEPVSVL